MQSVTRLLWMCSRGESYVSWIFFLSIGMPLGSISSSLPNMLTYISPFTCVKNTGSEPGCSQFKSRLLYPRACPFVKLTSLLCTVFSPGCHRGDVCLYRGHTRPRINVCAVLTRRTKPIARTISGFILFYIVFNIFIWYYLIIVITTPKYLGPILLLIIFAPIRSQGFQHLRGNFPQFPIGMSPPTLAFSSLFLGHMTGDYLCTWHRLPPQQCASGTCFVFSKVSCIWRKPLNIIRWIFAHATSLCSESLCSSTLDLNSGMLPGPAEVFPHTLGEKLQPMLQFSVWLSLSSLWAHPHCIL